MTLIETNIEITGRIIWGRTEMRISALGVSLTCTPVQTASSLRMSRRRMRNLFEFCTSFQEISH